MIELKVSHGQQRRFERELEKFYKKSQREFTHRVEQATLAAQRMAQRNAPINDGDLRQNIKVDMDKGNNIQGTVTSQQGYSAPVEYGSKPHMPPVDALRDWAKRKGIDPWAVAMSIKKKGTRSHPFMFPAWHKAQNDLLKGLRRVLK